VGVAVDNTSVYWTNAGSCLNASCTGALLSVPINGGTPVTLASSLGLPRDVVVDGTNLYWTQNRDGAVMKTSIQGGSPTPLAVLGPSQTTTYTTQGIVVDAVNAYWRVGTDTSGQYPASVLQVPLTGGSPKAIAFGQTGLGIATDRKNLYWISANNSGMIMKAPPGGNPLTTLASGIGAGRMAVDATSVYWTAEAAGNVMKLTPK
jgi:hypothetical protein